MGENTKISWADDTWNPVRGCEAVSSGCRNCYARELVNGRLGGDFSKRVRAADATFDAPLRWNKNPWVCGGCGEQSHENICWKCTNGPVKLHRRRVFLGSLMDWLDQEIPIAWLADALEIVQRCGGLDFLMLTKRPQNFNARLQECWRLTDRTMDFRTWVAGWSERNEPPDNVWVGTSIENQKRAEERLPELLKIPARVRFLSIEPLIDWIRLDRIRIGRPEEERTWSLSGTVEQGGWPESGLKKIHWVIVGGESGPGYRECDVEWIDYIAKDCRDAGVPCYVKQDCGRYPGHQGRIPGELWNVKEHPEA